MPTPILATKLFIPRPRPKAIHRPRLVERLDETRALTLVSAPAGFGKTSLLAEWVERRRLADRRLGVAWLSLDEADGDPFRFLLYLAAALQGIDPDCGADALSALQSPNPPSARSMLVDLINDIDGLAKDILVVLDDYHAVDSPKIDEEVGFLIENLPGRMHLIIATREDPSLPLARLRANGSLTELRAADLRFTSDEAADFLGRGMGLKLKTEEVAALESRTEGWIAGLQLAALSMQGLDDIAGFIASFTGQPPLRAGLPRGRGAPPRKRGNPGLSPADFLPRQALRPAVRRPDARRTGLRLWPRDPGIPRARQSLYRASGRRAKVVPLPSTFRRPSEAEPEAEPRLRRGCRREGPRRAAEQSQ